MPSATSSYGPNGVLQSQVQGVQGFAPSHLADLGQYFTQFKPDTRLPQATVAQQYAAFAPQRTQYHSDAGPTPNERMMAMQQPEEWVNAPARKLNFFGGPSGTVRVKKSDQAAQNGGQFGVIGY